MKNGCVCPSAYEEICEDNAIFRMGTIGPMLSTMGFYSSIKDGVAFLFSLHMIWLSNLPYQQNTAEGMPQKS